MKRIFALTILGIVTIGAVAWFANYLSTGTIVITTNDKNDTVTLQKTSGGKPFIKIATSSLSATVKHGQYTATVKDGLKTTIQVINFNSGHRTFRYSIALTNPQPAETVSYQSTLSVTTNENELLYLDTANILHKIDNQGDLQQINKDYRFKTVEWANPSFGVGQGDDGHLYTISRSSVSPLKVPFNYSGRVVNFDVSPDKRIYVSYGTDVYAGGQSGGFKKIYTASSSSPILAAGLNGVAVSCAKYGARPSNVSKPLLAVINVSGKETKKNIEAEKLTWSPNGQYLAIVNQTSPTIYDTALHQITIVPTGSVVGQFEWLNNTTLSYVSSYQFWTYNLPAQKTQLFADVPSTDSITGIYTSSDKSYVYITTLNAFSSNYAIKRIGLKGQSIPGYINKLQAVLPEILPDYSLNLVNFSQSPTIFVQPYVDAPPDNYIQKAQSQLQSQGVNTAPLRFELGPPSSGS